MKNNEWVSLIAAEFNVSNSTAEKMYDSMLTEYRKHINTDGACKYCHFVTDLFGRLRCYCWAQKGAPECYCNGSEKRCDK